MAWRPITVLRGKKAGGKRSTRAGGNARAGATSRRKGGKKGARLPISPREVEVLRLIADGARTDGVAKRLSLSEKTVRTHVQNLLRKLKMHSRVEAVVWAYQTRVARA